MNAHTLYAVGDTTSFGQPYQPLLLKLTAAQAKLQPSPLTAPDAMLSAITAVPGSTEMWATGVNDSTGMTVYLHLVGGAWSVQSQAAGGAGASLVAIGPDNVAAGGGAAHWNGAGWTAETVSGGDFDYAEAVAAAPNGKALWAVGESGSGSSVTAPRGQAHALAKRVERGRIGVRQPAEHDLGDQPARSRAGEDTLAAVPGADGEALLEPADVGDAVV